MKKEFDHLPRVFQTQILIRCGLGILFLFITILLVIMSGDVYMILPAAAVLAFCFGSALHLFRRGVTGEYIVIHGICDETEKTMFTRHIKAIHVKTGEYTVRISPRRRPRRIPTGANVVLYIAMNAPVYEMDGVQVLPSYIAMEMKEGQHNDNRRQPDSKTG